MNDLRGKVALITGGAGGLGRAVARAFGRRGARVALWDLDLGRVEEACAGLRACGVECRGWAVDVSDPEAVRAAAARARREFGEVDVLDNNAGVVFPGDFLAMDEAALAKTLDVNVKSFFWCTQAFLPGMLERGRGHLVMTASAAGLLGVPGMAAYSASKHAVVGFAESLRLELRKRRGVGMTIVCPSFVATGMFAGARPPRGTRWLKPEALADKIVEAVRRGRLYVREPAMVKLIPLLKAAPARWADWIGDVTGMHRALEGFGR